MTVSPPGRTVRSVLCVLGWLVLSWLLLGTSQQVATVKAASVSVRPSHPRLWLTPATLTRLRESAAANSPRWRSLKQICDESMNATDSWSASVMNYALAYQVSGNVRYADKAIALMQGYVARGMVAITDDQGYAARTLLPAMAVGYDWCYDRMTPDQRTLFRIQMERWADWVWPETNPSRATAWSVNNPGDNYFHGFMATWMVGLALYGDSPKAPGYVDVALKRWNEQVRPYLARYGAGGYSLEGTNYGTGTTATIFWYLAAHASATGEDLLNAPGFTWPQEAIRCKLYLTVPGRDRVYPAGDQSRVSSAPLSDYDRSSTLVSLSYLDATTAGYAKWWLDHVTPGRDVWPFDQWEELLWYRDDLPAADYTQVLSPGYLAPGAGWMTSRSGWATNATQVAMVCGPTRESHQDRAQNSFMIYRGDWLAAHARLNSHAGLYGGTLYNNSIMIGDYDQVWSQDTARVLHFAETDRYAYFSGDASGAYDGPRDGGPTHLVNEYRRELLFLKPDRVVIFDRIDAALPRLPKRWLLQTLRQPQLSEDRYQVTVGGATLFGTPVLPDRATLSSQPVNLGSGNSLSSWRVEVTAPVGQNLDHFLNVLEVAPAAQQVPTSVLSVPTSRGSLMGARIGGQVVLFDTAAASNTASPASYTLDATGPVEQYVLDQIPGKWYQVTTRSAADGSVQDQRAQATDQGVLTFSLSGSGPRTVTLRPSVEADGTSGPGPDPDAGGGNSSSDDTPPPPPISNLNGMTITVTPTSGRAGTRFQMLAIVRANGAPARGATVACQVGRERGVQVSFTGTTASDGAKSFSYASLVTGTYRVKMTATLKGVTIAKGEGAFTITKR